MRKPWALATARVKGQNNVLPNKMKQYPGNGTVTYTDILGLRDRESPRDNGEWTASIKLSVELKCTSEDGTSVSKSFKLLHNQNISFP